MKKAPISSIADVTAGQGAPKPDEFADSGIPFVRAGSLEDLLAGKSESDLELVPAETAKKRKLKLYPKGSILFAKSGMSATKDRIYVLQNPAYVVSHLAILTSKDNVFRDYLRLALKQFPPSSLIKDPAYPAIGLGEIQGYEIPVPEAIDDQKRIAHLLGKVEGLITRRKQHLQQLDDLLKSVFLEMFGNLPLDTTLGKECVFSQGIQIPVEDQKSEQHNGHVRFLRIIDYTQTDEPRYIEFPGERYCVNEDDVVMVRYGASAGFAGIGKSGAIANNLFKFNFDKNIIRPVYLYFSLKTQRFNAFIKKKVLGAAMPALSFGIMNDYQISIPPIDLQNHFAAIVEKAEVLKSNYQQSLIDLENLYGALSQKVFKGELDLSRVPLHVAVAERSVIEDVETKIQTDLEENHQRSPLSELVALTFAEGRKALLDQLLPTWLDQLRDTPFSAQHFMTHIEQRAADLIDAQDSDARSVEHEDVQFGPAEYDHLKTRIFEFMEQGRLTQGYDDANNRVQVRAAKE